MVGGSWYLQRAPSLLVLLLLLSCGVVDGKARCTAEDGIWAPDPTACVFRTDPGAPTCGKESGILLESYTRRTSAGACALTTGTLRLNPNLRSRIPCTSIACAIHCIGAWGPWGPCQPRELARPCGVGLQYRNFTVTVPAGNNGLPCPETEQSAQRAASRACVLPVFPCEPEIGPELCSDGIDNDGDGLTDTDAPGCRHPACPLADLDACFICGGNGSSCSHPTCGGANAPFVIPDACGVCGGRNDSCLSCAGVPNGPQTISACGVCGGTDAACSVAAPLTHQHSPAATTGCAHGWTGVQCAECIGTEENSTTNFTTLFACTAPRSAPERYALKPVYTPIGASPPVPGQFRWEGDWWYPSRTPRHLAPDGIVRGCDCLPLRPNDCGPMGAAVLPTGSCACPPGWGGPACAQRDHVDGGEREAIPSAGDNGHDPNVAPSCPPLACGLHGSCRVGPITWSCDCVSPWEGPGCTVSREHVLSYLQLQPVPVNPHTADAQLEQAVSSEGTDGREQLPGWELGIVSGMAVFAFVPLALAMYVRRLRDAHTAAVLHAATTLERTATAIAARPPRRWMLPNYTYTQARRHRVADLTTPQPTNSVAALICPSLSGCLSSTAATHGKEKAEEETAESALADPNIAITDLAWINSGSHRDADAYTSRIRNGRGDGMTMAHPRVPTLWAPSESSSGYGGSESGHATSDEIFYTGDPSRTGQVTNIQATPGEAARVICAELCGKAPSRNSRTFGSSE